MWQRLQTLYLGLSCALIAALFWCNAFRIAGPEGAVEYISFTEKGLYLTLLIITLVCNLACLFGYGIRLVQMRIAIICALLLLGFQGVIAYDAIKMHEVMTPAIPAIFPLLACILNVLAARSIFMDEAMVQEAARLRAPRKKRKKN